MVCNNLCWIFLKRILSQDYQVDTHFRLKIYIELEQWLIYLEGKGAGNIGAVYPQRVSTKSR